MGWDGGSEEREPLWGRWVWKRREGAEERGEMEVKEGGEGVGEWGDCGFMEVPLYIAHFIALISLQTTDSVCLENFTNS